MSLPKAAGLTSESLTGEGSTSRGFSPIPRGMSKLIETVVRLPRLLLTVGV